MTDRERSTEMNDIVYAGKHLLTFDVSWHRHNDWEFIYCTGGEGTLAFGENALSYREGDVLIIPPMVLHRNESEQGFTNIHLNVRDASLPVRSPTQVRDTADHFIQDAFRAAFYYFSSDRGRQSSLLAAYGNLIVFHIMAELDAPKHSPVVDDIRRVIVSSYPDENFQLESYLRSLPFNYDYLRKLFKSETGSTPHQFLTDTRLQAAAERLELAAKEQMSITEIAHLCGFHEPLYFSRVFRKKYGLSPLQYKDRSREREGQTMSSETVKIFS